MDLLVSADDSVSHGRPRLTAPPESTYGAVNYTMHLNQASQMEVSPWVTPLFELLGRTWQTQDEASCFNEDWKAANRHWKCVIPSKCYFLSKNLLKNQGGSTVVSATRRGRNKEQEKEKRPDMTDSTHSASVMREYLTPASTERRVTKKRSHSSAFPLQVDVGWSIRNISHQEVGPLRSTVCPSVWRELFWSLEAIPRFSKTLTLTLTSQTMSPSLFGWACLSLWSVQACHAQPMLAFNWQ